MRQKWKTKESQAFWSRLEQLAKQQHFVRHSEKTKEWIKMGEDDSIDYDVFFSRCPRLSFLQPSDSYGLITAFTLGAAAASANTVHSQSGRFNGIWVKPASQFSSMASKFFPPASTHRWMHTFWNPLSNFSHFALKIAVLLYCAHLFCVTKCAFTDSKFKVILPSFRSNCFKITPTNMLLVFKYFLCAVICTADAFGDPASALQWPWWFPCAFIVNFKKLSRCYGCFHCATPLTPALS